MPGEVLFLESTAPHFSLLSPNLKCRASQVQPSQRIVNSDTSKSRLAGYLLPGQASAPPPVWSPGDKRRRWIGSRPARATVATPLDCLFAGICMGFMCVIPTTKASKLLKTEVCQGGTPSPSPVQWITSATTDQRLNLQGHLSTTMHARQFLPKFHCFHSVGVQHYLDENMSFWFPSICRNQISIHLHFRYLTRFVQGWVGVGSSGIGEDLHDGYIISDFARLCAFAHFHYFLI